MATIVDPDDLRLSSASAGNSPDGEVYIDTENLTIELLSTTEFTNSSRFSASDGVSLQALYSFLKEEWKNNDTDDFYRFRFPMEAITSEQFEFINGWAPKNDTTRSYIRTAGWAEKDTAGTEQKSYMGVITLGNIESNQTAYYGWYSTASSEFITDPTNFTYNGPVNEAVKIYENSDSAAANFDYRSDYNLFTYIRPTPEGNSSSAGGVTGYTYGQSSTDAIGTRDSVTNQVYRFPLATAVDLKITKNDTESASIETAVGYRLRFDQASLSSSQLPAQLSGGTANFTHLIDSTNGDSELLTTSEIYNVTQYKLRLNSDIDDEAGASRIGKLTEELKNDVSVLGEEERTRLYGINELTLAAATERADTIAGQVIGRDVDMVTAGKLAEVYKNIYNEKYKQVVDTALQKMETGRAAELNRIRAIQGGEQGDATRFVGLPASAETESTVPTQEEMAQQAATFAKLDFSRRLKDTYFAQEIEDSERRAAIAQASIGFNTALRTLGG